MPYLIETFIPTLNVSYYVGISKDSHPILLWIYCNDAAHLYTFTSFYTDDVYYSGNKVI